MKVPKSLVAVAVILAVAIAALFLYSMPSPPPPECTSVWKCAAPYPLQSGGNPGVAGQQCIDNSTVVYCVGGVDSSGVPRADVYLGSIGSSGNVTSWSVEAHPYPQSVTGHSCVLMAGYLFCIGGIHDTAGDDISSSYFSKVEANGTLGSWLQTTSYPVAIDSQSCVGWSNRIYCVAGNNETSGAVGSVEASSSVWYASANSSGIGAWIKSTPYPSGVYVPSCFASSGYIYCLGGSDGNGDPLGNTYYAALTSSGVGSWTATATDPLPAAGAACAVTSGYIYCVGGETGGGQTPTFGSTVYYATISPSGLGAWSEGPDYPRTVGTSCVASAGSLYCFGGFDENGETSIVNYASLSSLTG